MKFSVMNNFWQFSQFTFEMISIWCSAAYLAKELEESWPSGWMFLLLFRFFLPGSSICSSLTCPHFLYSISTSFCFFLTLFKFQQQGFKLFREWTPDSLNLRNYFMWTPLRTPMQDRQKRRNNKDKMLHVRGWKLHIPRSTAPPGCDSSILEKIGEKSEFTVWQGYC